MRATICSTLLLVACALPAFAGQVDRAKVTLGALVDECDRVVLARVESVREASVTLAVLETVKGGAVARLNVPAGDVTWKEGERALVLVRTDANGEPLALGSSYQKIDAATDAAAAELVRAAKSRLPRLEGDDAQTRGELFKGLESPNPRLREDAAIELGAHRELAPTDAERAILGRTLLEREANPDLLELARRLASPGLLAPVLGAARGAKDDATCAAAARALDAIDKDSAIRSLGEDLSGRDEARSTQAARVLAGIAGEEAAKLLAARLDDGRLAVRKAALRGLADADCAAKVAAKLARVLEQPQSPEEAELAAAALARAGAGAELAKAEKAERMPEKLRALVKELRADPISGSRRVLDR